MRMPPRPGHRYDTGYFCRIFKRKTKFTPTLYRLQSDGRNRGKLETE